MNTNQKVEEVGRALDDLCPECNPNVVSRNVFRDLCTEHLKTYISENLMDLLNCEREKKEYLKSRIEILRNELARRGQDKR